jgi:hypothetical protein
MPMANVRVAQHRLSNHDHPKTDERAEAPVVPRRMVPPLRPQAECAGACGYPENDPDELSEANGGHCQT